jgi:hypothetical protein
MKFAVIRLACFLSRQQTLCLPLPAYRGDRLESALRSGGLWPNLRGAVECRPDAWGRVSFAATPVSIVGWIDDPHHSLASGMDVDVPNFDCLLIAPSITLEGLDHLILKPKQLDGVVAVNVDEVLGQGCQSARQTPR